MSQRTVRTLVSTVAALVASAGAAAEDVPTLGEFSLPNLQVPLEAIISGGPTKDRIRSVDEPEFAPVEDASWAGPLTELLGVAIDEQAHAYPIRMLEYHQIVNDRIGDEPVVATYDPLAGVPLAYERTVDGRTLSFGVSGLLYNHNFLLYDRETESLWSQFLGKAIAGPLAGKQLVRVVARQETARNWFTRFPGTQVLRHPKPEKIEYRVSPYQTYWVQNKISFPVAASDPRYHAKELVLGVVVGAKARAYIGSVVTREGGEVEDAFEGVKVRFVYDTETGTFSWDIPEPAVVTEAYWLAWKAFHPKTEIWRDQATGG